MTKTIVKAVFIGEDKSLGYENGKKYSLKFSSERKGIIGISRMDDTGMCIYENIFAFLQNWSNISWIKSPLNTNTNGE